MLLGNVELKYEGLYSGLLLVKKELQTKAEGYLSMKEIYADLYVKILQIGIKIPYQSYRKIQCVIKHNQDGKIQSF